MAELVKPKKTKSRQRKSASKVSNPLDIAPQPIVAARISDNDVEDVDIVALEVTESLETKIENDLLFSNPEINDNSSIVETKVISKVAECVEDVLGEEATESLKTFEVGHSSAVISKHDEIVDVVANNIGSLQVNEFVEAPYENVKRELNQCREEILLPSAPVIDVAFSSECTKEAVCYNIVEVEEAILEEGPFLKDVLSSFSIEREVETELTPFTEHDLSLLYKNEELETIDSFLQSFSHKTVPEQDELFKTITKYIGFRRELSNNLIAIEETNAGLIDIKEQVWSVWPGVELKEKALCGHKNEVWVTHRYQEARLNPDALEKFDNSVTTIQSLKMVTTQQVIEIKYLKKLIDYRVWKIQESILPFTKNDLGITLTNPSPLLKENMEKLCCTIDVLFHFLRVVPTTVDDEAVQQLKSWLSVMLTLILKVGLWREQLFVLSHILYCPTSIALWAADFIQCPPRFVDHACAMLALMLQPLPRREKFLDSRLQVGPWVLVDSDGVDDEADINIVQEEILLKLFNQIPLQQMLVNCIVTEARDVSEYALLKLLAFYSTLLKSIRTGICTYGDNEHRHFGKRLGKLVRELVELVTDQLDLFLEIFPITTRLQAEYDAFLLRATEALMTKPLVWQFLASAPFYQVSYAYKWLIYRYITFSQSNEITYSDFAQKLCSVDESEQCHLLTALANLALAKGQVNKKLTRTIVLQLLYIGFVHDVTSLLFYKDAKSLLASLFAQDSHLFPETIDLYDALVDNNDLCETNSQLMLWQALPIALWTLTKRDVANVCKWLSLPYSSNRCEIARFIIRKFDCTKMDFNGQYSIARTIVFASKNSKEFNTFSWTALKRLQLHLIDRGYNYNDSQMFSYIPNLNEDAEMGYLISQNSTTAIFFALETTSVGHFVPIIYSEGFKFVKNLVDNRQYDAAFLSIHHLTSMFWGCPESLFSNQAFSNLLNHILTLPADEYWSVIKPFQSQSTPGSVLQIFGDMLHFHLEISGIDHIEKAVHLWLRVLINLPNWQQNDNVTYLLDVVCRQAFNHPGAWQTVLDILEATLPLISSSERSTLRNFLRIGYPPIPTLLVNGSSGNSPCFAFASLSVEFDVLEKKTCLWNELIRELSNSRGKKTNIDASLKKVCVNLKLPLRTSSQLVFYKYVNQILEMSINDPLSILMCKQLMELFVNRVAGLVDRGSPGSCFFHGVTNCSLLKRLTDRLLALSNAQPDLSSTYKSIILWLKEPVILEPNLIVATLPAHYNAPLLSATLSGESYPWYFLLPISKIRQDLANNALAWQLRLGRTKKTLNNTTSLAVKPPKTRIFDRLEDLTHPTSLPNVILLPAPLRDITFNSQDIPCNLQAVKTILVDINSCALNWTAIRKIVCILSEMYEKTYKSIDLRGYCSGVTTVNRTISCSLPAWIKLSYFEWSLHATSKGIYDFLFTKMQRDLTSAFHVDEFNIISLVFITNISEFCREEDLPTDQYLQYFDIVFQLWKIVNPIFNIMVGKLEKCLFDLSMSMKITSSNELVKIIDKIIEHPKATFLVELFNPNLCGNEEFITIFGYVLKALKDDHDLLQSFDVPLFLLNKQTKLHSKSKLLSIILDELMKPSRAPKVQPIIHSQLNVFLREMLIHEFPEHYGHVFQTLVESRAAFSKETWFAFLNALLPSDQFFQSKDIDNIENLILNIKKCAVDQTWLSLSVLTKSIQFLDKTWTKYLMSDVSTKDFYGLYGDVAEPLIITLSFLAHCFIVRFIAEQTFTVTEEAVNTVWPKLEALFKPWVAPVLKTGHVFKFPFDATHASLAILVATFFRESLQFLMSCLSRSEILLDKLLSFYIQNYCSPDVPGLVLSVIHVSLNVMPWKRMKPSLKTVESILQVVNLCVPLCHEFLGKIFISVDWKTLVEESFINNSTESNAYLLTCLLHLLVKFPSEPSLKQKKEVISILETAAGYGWHVLSAECYVPVLTWFTCSCSPDVVLGHPGADYHEQDTQILRLLKIAAGYDANLSDFHYSTGEKRRLFVASMVKCLATVACRRQKWSSNDLVQNSLSKLLTDIEVIIPATVVENKRLDDGCVLLVEVLRLLTECKIEQRVEEGIIKWMKSNPCGLVSTALLRCAGSVISNPIIYSNLTEQTIDLAFMHRGIHDWATISQLLCPYANGTVYLDEVLISNSYFLTLNTVYLQKLGMLRARTPEFKIILNNLIRFLPTIKPKEKNEPKMVLLMCLAIKLAILESDLVILHKMCDISTTYVAEQSGGFLTTIGLKKQSGPSAKMKLCCLTIAAGLTNVLMTEYKHDTGDKSWEVLKRAESIKNLQPVMADVLSVRNDLLSVRNSSELIIFVYKIATQLFNKSYFVM